MNTKTIGALLATIMFVGCDQPNDSREVIDVYQKEQRERLKEDNRKAHETVWADRNAALEPISDALKPKGN